MPSTLIKKYVVKEKTYDQIIKPKKKNSGDASIFDYFRLNTYPIYERINLGFSAESLT